MSIQVDGQRIARAWREWQTVFGGANLSAEAEGLRLDARITKPFGRQEYAFALRVDGVLQPGSDLQPEPRAVKRQTLKALGWIALVVFVTTFAAAAANRLT